jgi:hypothetical protein
MSPVFQVAEIYRPAERRGPILVGAVSSGTISVGSRLVSSVNSEQVLEVIAVDLPTAKSQAEGRLAVVVLPDLGDQLCPGAEYNIVPPER